MTIKIQVIGSSSSGNCYRISDGHTPLLLEAGIPLARVKKAINFELSAICGCLVTHCHLDHFKAVHDLLKAGVDCYMSWGTAEAKCLTTKGVMNHHRARVCQGGKQFAIGTWLIMPFATVHDCPESLGFLLQSRETGEKVLFATDTAYLPNRFNGLTHIMVECNYDEMSLQESVNKGSISMAQYNRIIATHFGLDNVVEFLQANNLTALREVHLLHLSDLNSNKQLMVETIQRLTGVPVYACAK